MTARSKGRLVFAAALLFAAAAFVFAAAENYGILGYGDVVMVFRPASPTTLTDRVRRSLTWRLGALETYADLTTTEDEVRVTVNRRAEALVASVALWEGGVQIFRIANDYDLPPIERSGVTTEGPDALGGRRYVGTAEALFPVLAVLDKNDPRVMALPVEGTNLYRSVVFAREPAFRAVTRSGAATYLPDGKTVELFFDENRSVDLDKLGDPNDYVVSVARGAVLLRGFAIPAQYTSGIHQNTRILLHAGDDLRAYKRAYRLAALLNSPPIPRLTLTSHQSLPTNVTLGVLNVVIPLLVAASWFAIVRRFDRAQPEPWWLVLATGAIAMILAVPELIVRHPVHGSSWDPHLLAGIRRIEAFPRMWFGFTLEAGLPEEGLKLLAVLTLARWRKAFDEPIDGIVYMAAAAIGFSCIEEYGYLYYGRLHASLVAVRATSCPVVHVFFTSIVGYALGQGIGKGWRGAPFVALAYVGAAVCHGLYDALVDSSLFATVGHAYQIALLLLFVYLVRRALRGSSVTLQPAKNAKIVRAGSWVRFAFFTTAFVVAASWLIQFASQAPADSTLSTTSFVAMALGLAVTIAFIARILVAAVPLDVVIDDRGVTFSGVTHDWSSIGSVHQTTDAWTTWFDALDGGHVLRRGISAFGRRLILDTSAGPFVIDALSTANASVVLTEIQARVGKVNDARPDVLASAPT